MKYIHLIYQIRILDLALEVATTESSEFAI